MKDLAPGLIETSRLLLVPLPFEAYGLLLAGRNVEAERLVGLSLDGSRLAELAPLIRYQYDQLQQDPTQVAWLVRLIRLRDHPTVVGDIGFHAPPDDNGMVEIGYTILQQYRRQGFAMEAAMAMAGWAANHPRVRTLRASISPDNEPSLRLARGLGMVEVGRQMDEIDGEEIVLEVPLPFGSDARSWRRQAPVS